MDLVLLGRALNSDNARRDRVGAATAAVVGVTLLDLFCSQQFTRRMQLSDASMGYDMFVNKEDECVKVVLKP